MNKSVRTKSRRSTAALSPSVSRPRPGFSQSFTHLSSNATAQDSQDKKPLTPDTTARPKASCLRTPQMAPKRNGSSKKFSTPGLTTKAASNTESNGLPPTAPLGNPPRTYEAATATLQRSTPPT